MTSFEYDLSEPDPIKLPAELREISGMTLYDENSLLAIQDEYGIVFRLSASDGQILQSIEFGADGDYEGIALVDSSIFVLRSDGTLFELKNWQTSGSKPISISIGTPLQELNNTEGLCYDAKNHCLLIACKEHGTLNIEDTTTQRSIYRFDLKTRKLAPKPAYIISQESLQQYLATLDEEDENKIELKALSEEDSSEPFIYPSDIAIHPISGDLYIPSARSSNCILVLRPDGSIKTCVYLPSDDFKQTEGICFAPNGDMYLSSEGGGKKGKLYFFEWNSAKE